MAFILVVIHQYYIQLFLALKDRLNINFPYIIILKRHFLLESNVLDCEHM